jgi:protein O-GlcNAc transferase
MDYRISDPYFDPPDGELLYVEKTIRLPRTYWCYQSGGETPDVTALPARREGRITFGCLNNFAKVSEQAIGLWARVMGNVPLSRLLIQCATGSTSERVKSRFEALGVNGDRVQIVSRVPWDQYMRAYNDIDIALDPFPFGGGITTCDALWMGAAVVTLSGRTAVGRGGRSILSNVGLAELIAFEPEQYVKIATDLAQDLPRLEGLRAGMRARMLASPLMDALGFARDMEGVYRQMWRQWCDTPSGERPAPADR